jgi:hypothetical protein
MVQASLRKWKSVISKTTRAKRVEGVVQVGECLPSKCKVLSSNPNTSKTFFVEDRMRPVYNFQPSNHVIATKIINLFSLLVYK